MTPMKPSLLSLGLLSLSLLLYVCAVALLLTEGWPLHSGWASPAFAAASMVLNIWGSWLQRRQERMARQLRWSHHLQKLYTSYTKSES